MDLVELERLAKVADEKGSDLPLIYLHSACDPAVILRLVAIAKAAERYVALQRQAPVGGKSLGDATQWMDDLSDAGAALREALEK